MGLLGGLAMLVLVLICFEQLPSVRAQSTRNEARALDVLLQEHAYRGFVTDPKTGIIYEGNAPSNFSGIKVSALRLRSGSLRRRGVNMYNEFEIPTGITETPYVERLVLVYQNLGNWSTKYYELPNHTYLAPVLGLVAYDGSNLSATNLQELNINATGDPILIKFQDVKSDPDGAFAKCVSFDLQGSSKFSNVKGGNTCSTFQQGHFSIVVESSAPGPVPGPAPAPGTLSPPPGPTLMPRSHGEKKSNNKVWIIVGAVLGGLVLLVLLSLLVLWVRKYKKKEENEWNGKGCRSRRSSSYGLRRVYKSTCCNSYSNTTNT